LNTIQRGAEQRVASHKRRSDEKRERRQPIERPANEHAVSIVHALNETAKHQTLRNGRDDRPGGERDVHHFLPRSRP
jgi:hypothetical protein